MVLVASIRLAAGDKVLAMPRPRFSFPSRRDHSDPWFHVGSVEVTTSVLVAGLCVLSFFLYAANSVIVEALVLFPDDVRSGQIWRVVTWPLANAASLNAAITVAIFWYIGSRVESLLGRLKFLWLLLIVTTVAGILATALDVPLFGLRPIELAVFVVFACEYPKMPFFFGIPAWGLAAVIVGIELLQKIGDRDGDGLIVYVATIAAAIWVARSFGMLVAFQWLPQIKNPFARRKKPTGAKVRSNTASVVVDGPWPTSPPMYTPMQDQHEVDQILDKIAVVGMDGLTADEKKRLNEASRRLRKKGD
jgi:membrane associated rhomboid family serine protease